VFEYIESGQMNETAQWVYDIVAKMDDDEARFFTMLLADNLHEWEVENNSRTIRGVYNKIQKSIDDDLAKYFLRELRAGTDPELLVAQAAAVSISKAQKWENTWYQYQQRDQGGRFGSMSGGQYRAGKKAAKAQERADILGIKAQHQGERVNLKALAGGKYEAGPQGEYASAREYDQGRAMAVGNQMSYLGHEAEKPVASFGERYHRMPNKQLSGTTDSLNRLEASGDLVTSLGLATGKTNVAVAGQAASLVGHYGPEAEKVVGPGMRKAAYRYRGTERTPDKKLNTLQEQAAQRVLRQEGKSAPSGVKAVDALTPPQKVFAAEEGAINYMLGNVPDAYEGKGRTGNRALDSDMRRQNSRVPRSSMANLHRQSGKVTPSEGVMIDGQGNIVAQAVGYGEDHYIPFNLKNLGALKGGSYVRTRESGGLTSEDIYTGLLSGARSMTVVSNSGVFTMHFDDQLRGGRRYNDKAKQMVGRYEHILDAIQSQEVQNPARAMTPAQRAQIRLETETKVKQLGLDLTDEEMDKEVKNAIKERAKRPKLSPEEELQVEENAAKIDDGTPRGKHDANEYRYGMRERILDNKAGQNYKLDGEGYKAALQAMQEQFPYYVDDVEYVTTDRTEVKTSHPITPDDFKPKEDKGYIKPRYNRPEGAKSGYFDTTVTGEGKRGADRTNYQNWRVQQHTSGKENENKERVKPREGDEEGTTSTATSGSLRDRARAQSERGESIEQRRELKNAVKTGLKTWHGVNNDTIAAGRAAVLSNQQHPNMMKWNALPEDERDAFEEANAEGLRKELRQLGTSSHAAQLKAVAPHMPIGEIDPVGEVERKHAKPKWDDTKLKGETPPKNPMHLEDDALSAAMGDDSVQKIMRDHPDEESLHDFSKQTRAKIVDAEWKNKPTKALEDQVKKIEQARSVLKQRHQVTATGSAPSLATAAPAAAPVAAPVAAPAAAPPVRPNMLKGHMDRINDIHTSHHLSDVDKRDAYDQLIDDVAGDSALTQPEKDALHRLIQSRRT
jgi:hypothetical protein